MASTNASVVHNNGNHITTLHGVATNNNIVSSMATNYSIAANSLVLQPQEQQQQQSSILTIGDSVLPVVTQVVPDQTLLVHNVNDIAGLQGILPGEGSSMITHLTPTLMSQVQPTATIQTISINDAQLATQAASFSVDQNQLIQLPIVSTEGIIPSTITIDQNLLKTNSDTLSLNNQAPFIQNVATNVDSKCILVDGNIISGNTIVGQVITSDNVPVQPILMTDANTNLLLNGIPQTITQLSSMGSSNIVNPSPHSVLLPSISTVSPVKTVQITPKKQQNMLKKTKTIQSISNFTPDSSVFSNNNSSKSTKPTNSTNLKTTPARNVIIKKTINVIKKSENTVVPMKPTSVEQVQPGVFKFQLKKVDSNEAESLLQSNFEIPTTIAKTSENAKTYHVTIPSNRKPDTKVTSTRIVIPGFDSRTKGNSSSLEGKSTQATSATKTTGSMASRMKMSFKSPATVTGTSKAPPKSSGTVSQNKQGGTSNSTSSSSAASSVSSVKSITVPKSLFSKLKGKMTDGNVLKVTDTALLNELLALSKSPKKSSDKVATETCSIIAVGAKSTCEFVPKTTRIVTRPANLNKSQTIPLRTNSPGNMLSSSKQLTTTTSPEKIFIPAPTTKSNTLSTTKSNTLSTTKSNTLSTTKSNALSTTKFNTLSTTKSNTFSATSNVSSGTGPLKKKTEVNKQVDTSSEDDLQCKESGFLSPKSTITSTTTSQTKNSLQQENKQLKNPVLVLNKLNPPPSVHLDESSQDESQDDLSSREDSDEVKTIRAAINSSHVGEQEKHMRDLARQEIENQLKRFCQKDKKDAIKIESKKENTKQETKSSVLSTKKASTSVPTKKRKNSDGASVSSTDKNSDTNPKFSDCSDDTQSRSVSKKLKIKGNTTVEQSRKRGRPKKYDDFVLPSKAKKEKKNRKFFFPKDTTVDDVADDTSGTETSLQDDVPSSPQQNEVISTSPPQQGDVINISKQNDVIKTSKQNADEKNVASTKKKEKTAKIAKKNTQSKKTLKTKKYKKRKNKQIAFEAATLPDHLKTKPKPKTEDAVIDLSKVKLKSAFAETTYNLDDKVSYKTYKLLQRKTWLCTLCGKPGNLGSLDVLFGPYKINVQNEKSSKTSDMKMNVWLHRDCAIWTSNICLSNQKLCGLGESLDEAAITVSL